MKLENNDWYSLVKKNNVRCLRQSEHSKRCGNRSFVNGCDRNARPIQEQGETAYLEFCRVVLVENSAREIVHQLYLHGVCGMLLETQPQNGDRAFGRMTCLLWLRLCTKEQGFVLSCEA